jgi:hypothetical protein
LYKLSVVGPDDCSFKKAVSALHQIYAFFEDSFSEGVMRPHIQSEVGILNAIMAQTCFIMSTMYNVFPEVPVLPQFDPDNILGQLIDTGHFKFTEDNIVSFFEVLLDDDG